MTTSNDSNAVRPAAESTAKKKSKRVLSPLEVKEKEAAQAIGDLLTKYLKCGPLSEEHRAATEKQILAIAIPVLGTAQAATDDYRAECKRFLKEVIKVKGMPTASVVTSDRGDDSWGIVSSSGADVEKAFPQLLPSIRSRVDWCVENFSAQARRYLDIRIEDFRRILTSFVITVPTGGSKDKQIRSRITEIKREFRSLCEWESLFEVYKQTSLSTAIEHIFTLQRNPIAATWHCSTVEEQSDAPRNDHRQFEGRIYAVRGNWAIQKGFMQARAHGYLDDVSMPPQQEIGCMCEYTWIYALRSLPDDMVTDKGRCELQRVRKVIDEMSRGRGPFSPDTPETPAQPTPQASPRPQQPNVESRGVISRFMSLFKKGL